MSNPNPPDCGEVGPLEVHGQETHALVGEKQVLALWSNRTRTSLRHEWRVISAPASSQLFLAEPAGVTTLAKPDTCQRAYFDGSVPNFTPDLPGLYIFEVRTVEPSTGQVAIGQAHMRVTQQGSAPIDTQGCSVGASLPLLCLGLLLLRRSRL